MSVIRKTLVRDLINISSKKNYVLQNCRRQSQSEVVIRMRDKFQPQTQQIKRSKEPFVNNLFVGIFDYDMLTYPEVLNSEELNELNQWLSPLEEYVHTNVNSVDYDKNEKISEGLIEYLKSVGVFGLEIPKKYGGLEYSATKNALVREILAVNGSLSFSHGIHQDWGVKCLLMFGTEDQKSHYLPRILAGEDIAFCLHERDSGTDPSLIKTSASLDHNNTWKIKGVKHWVTNGSNANIFIVFAKPFERSAENILTAFIVERALGGISSKRIDKFGLKAADISEVTFHDSPVSESNILGNVGDGFKIASNVLCDSRYYLGSSVANSLKPIMNSAVNHVINKNAFGKPLKDYESIKEKISLMALRIYAMESMSYLVAGNIDSCEKPNCVLEGAIIKIFTSENAFKIIQECLDIVGPNEYCNRPEYEIMLRDLTLQSSFDCSNDVLRLFISLMGIQHAGTIMAKPLKMMRNPFTFPEFNFKKFFSRKGSYTENPKLTLGLDGYLHPSLRQAAHILELGVLRLKWVTEALMVENGIEICEQQMQLKKLADIVIDLYVMTAVLGRASRSYCIGLRNSEMEILMAGTFCRMALDRIQYNIACLSEWHTAVDSNLVKIADSIFQSKSYCAEHPLTRNF